MKYILLEDQVNLPIFMDSPDEIQYNVNSCYDCEGRDPEPGGELLHDYTKVQRDAMVWSIEDETIPVFGDSFAAFYLSKTIVFHRRRDFGKTKFKMMDNGDVLMEVKTDPTQEVEIKHDTRIIWTPDTLLFFFNHQLDGKHLSELSSNEERIRTLTKLAMKQSLINVLRDKTDKKVWLNGNDVLIGPKKICGGEGYDYDIRYHEHGMIQFGARHDIFNKYLIGDRNHEASLKKRGIEIPAVHGETSDNIEGGVVGSYSGIGSIEEEIPGYTKQEFAEDFVKEVNKFVKMLK